MAVAASQVHFCCTSQYDICLLRTSTKPHPPCGLLFLRIFPVGSRLVGNMWHWESKTVLSAICCGDFFASCPPQKVRMSATIIAGLLELIDWNEKQPQNIDRKMNGSAEPVLLWTGGGKGQCCSLRMFNSRLRRGPFHTGQEIWDLISSNQPACMWERFALCPSSVGCPGVLGDSGQGLVQPREPRSAIPVPSWRT